jgi:hypothetical protein
MTWKLITEPTVIVEKICNECGKVIETFDATHPLTQYMVFDLQLNEKSDLSVLDLGLQPYHWCPLTPSSHCLVPIMTTKREQLRDLENKIQEAKKQQTLFPSLGNFAPYKSPHIKIQEKRGRPFKFANRNLALRDKAESEDKKNE